MAGQGGLMKSMWAPRPDELVGAKKNKNVSSPIWPTSKAVNSKPFNARYANLGQSKLIGPAVCLPRSSEDSWAKQPATAPSPQANAIEVIPQTMSAKEWSAPANSSDLSLAYVPPHLQRMVTPAPAPTLTEVETTPLEVMRKWDEDHSTVKQVIKAQCPIPAADSNLPAENLPVPRAPSDGPQKPAQLAATWKEFTAWGHILPSGTYRRGSPVATKKAPYNWASVQINKNSVAQSVISAKLEDVLPRADNCQVGLEACQSIRTIPRVKPAPKAPVSTKAWGDLALYPTIAGAVSKSTDIAPVSEWAQSAQNKAVHAKGEDRVADEINDVSTSQDKPRQQLDSRNYLAPELRIANGTFGPVVASYDVWIEADPFSFINSYVSKWSEGLPVLKGQVDMDSEQFKTGACPVLNLKFGDVIEQPLCYPDVANSSNNLKQQNQTANIDAKYHQHVQVRRQRQREHIKLQANQPVAIPQNLLPTINPWAPTAAIYLRAAREKDVPGMVEIYNHYVVNSIIPEDHEPVSEVRLLEVVLDCRREKCPFIVAVKGNPPATGHMDDDEIVLGFALAEDRRSRIGLSNTGRSRLTAQVELYIHPEHLRQGIGCCLFDRLLSAIGPNHTAHGGHDFLHMPEDGNMYRDPRDFKRLFHQIFIHRAIRLKDDPDIAWFTRLMEKFYFFEVGRLRSAGRSSKINGLPRFLDIVVFQYESAVDQHYDILT